MSVQLANMIARLAVERRFVHKEERYGQGAMNALHSYSPEIYSKISGTQADCFYMDDLVMQFYMWLETYNEDAM